MSPQVAKRIFTDTDGSIHEFPGDTTPEEMEAILSSRNPPPVDQNAINRANLIKTAPSHQFIDPRGTPSSYIEQPSDTTVDVARPIVSGFAGDVAGLATAPIPIPGSSLGAYTGTYSVVDALMQYLKKDKPSSPGSALQSGALNAVTGKALTGLLNRIVPAIKAYNRSDQPDPASIMSLQPTSSQALKAQGFSFLAGGAKLLEDLNLSSKEKALERTAGQGTIQALRFAKINDSQALLDDVISNMPLGEGSFTPLERSGIPYTPIKINEIQGVTPINKNYTTPSSFSVTPGDTKYLQGGFQPGEPNLNLIDNNKKVNDLLKDLPRLQSTLTTAQTNGVGDNLKKSLGDFHFAEVFNNAATRDASGNVIRLDSEKINAGWADPALEGTKAKLYNAPTRAAMDQFFKNIEATQDKINVGGSGYSKFRLMRQGVYIAGSLLTGAITGHTLETAAGVTGAVITTQTLGALLRNPTTARIMVALAGKEPLGMSEQLAGRLIVRALQGTTIALINSDGKKTPAQIDRDGKLQPIQ